MASNLNSFVLYTFLMGIYTIVYFGTLCAYLTRKINRCRIVISTITALYLLGIFQLALQWYLTYWEFIKYGATRDSVYASYFEIPAWSEFMLFFCPLSSLALADGLLLWRCFHVWNGSIRVMALPSFLIFLEIGSFISAMILQGLFAVPGTTILSEQQVAMDNAVIAAQNFLSVAASLVTTLLIVLRIHSMSKENGGSGQRFKHILDIVVQSAAVYSLVILVEAITFVLPDTGDMDNTQLFALGSWMDNLSSVISGMVPTIMVARIILTCPDTTCVSAFQLNMSGLKFDSCSTINIRESRIANFDVMDIRRDSSSTFEDKKDMV